jgi:hypothetical protein
MQEEDQKRTLTEKEKSFLGLPYNAMEDPELIKGRLRARKYVKAYNVNVLSPIYTLGADCSNRTTLLRNTMKG